jgi:hypothetical protein
MKRPTFKRAKKDKQAAPAAVAPQQLGAHEQPATVTAATEKKRRLRGAKKAKVLTPQEQATSAAAPAPSHKGGRLRRVLGAPLRMLRKPLGAIARLKGAARLIVWGVLAVLVVFAALQLRGGRDDAALVRASLERYEKASADKDVQELCDDLLASSYVKQTASSGLPCEVALRTALEDVNDPKLRVLSVEVNGDRAAARVRGSAAGQVPGDAVYTLVREGDSWRILPPRPSGAAP